MTATLNATQLKKKLPAFKDWLVAHGAEALLPTNEWEMARFKAAGITGIVYCNSVGRIKLQGPAAKALPAFLEGKAWSAGVATARKKKRGEVATLLDRDGDACWLCGLALGEDLTVEHLVPVVHGGPQHLSNKVMTHALCNSRMGHRSVAEKVLLRDAARAALKEAPGGGQERLLARHDPSRSRSTAAACPATDPPTVWSNSMNTIPKTITGTTSAWFTNEYYGPEELKREPDDAINRLHFYPDDIAPDSWIRAGSATITITLDDENGFIEKKVEILQAQKTALMADHQFAMTALEGKIQQLLAITMTEAA